ncbi:MAG: DUF1553 domain-containing protein [Pirellulales bacterium]
MHRSRRRNLHTLCWSLVCLASVWFVCAAIPRIWAADEPSTEKPPAISTEARDFFEQKIRPVLVEHCYSCHAEKSLEQGQLKGGLLVDSRAGLLQGGDSGPAIVPGKPDDSLLLQALRYEGLEMPPKGKLPDPVLADFEAWIRSGAPDPRVAGGVVRKATIDIEAGRRHWAYQLPAPAATPHVQRREFVRDPYDAFLVQRWEQERLTPAAVADRATLIRRLSFDLRGLPPSAEEVDQFVADDAPDALERLVDRWLASPAFGERWARHWLDIARYAESITLRGFVLADAWRYRDYVIETFQQDRPLSRFIEEQIAGDLLSADSLEAQQRQRIATTYLALGNTNLEEQDKKQLRMDYVDEQLDVIGKGLLGQTLSCARCHDHKFDPIPTRDYYAMAGVFRSTKALEHANVSKWLELPLPLPADEEARYRQHEQLVKQTEARVKQMRDAVKAATSPKQPAKQVAAPTDFPGIVVDDARAKKVGEWKESQFTRPYIGAGYVHDLDTGKGDKTLTFQPELPKAGQYEVRLAYSPGGNRSGAVPVTVFSADGETTVRVDQRTAPPIDGHWTSLGKFRFEMNGQGFVIVSNEGTTGHVIADAVQFLPVGELEQATAAATGKPPQAAAAAPESGDVQARAAELKQLEAELKQLQQSLPKRPTYISVREEDGDEIGDTQVHIRGLVSNLGPTVPRGVLQVALYDAPPVMPERESGRRELAQWLASPRNPLTARVYVNRVWHWLYGQGLVRTPDNFGTTGEAPSHPELLDRLTVDFLADDWSTKSLVRRLATLHAYRLDDRPLAAAATADPENRWLTHARRRRLDAESLVDSILSLSGELDRRAYGPTLKPDLAADYGYQHDSKRRALYWPVLRNVLPEVFEAFDFADPSLVTGKRTTSTVATQALLLNNHPFVLSQSRATARRLLADSTLQHDSERLERLYRDALGRTPTSGEREPILAFVAAGAARPEETWSQVVQVVVSSLDFRYQ